MTSPDGITWTAQTGAGDSACSLCWSSELSLFVILLTNGNFYTSPNGIIWTYSSVGYGESSWKGICWSPELGLFLAVSAVDGYHNYRCQKSLSPKCWDASGRYTPTLTAVANISASTTALCQWSRKGRVVTVSGRISIDPTTTGTATELGISLPVPSAFVNVNDCGGTASAMAVKETGGIIANAALARATLKWFPTDVTNQPYAFQFSYFVY